MKPEDYEYSSFVQELLDGKTAVRIQDLEIGDSIHLYFEDGDFFTDMVMKVQNPYCGEVLVHSTSTFGVFVHVRNIEGCCLGSSTASTQLTGWLIIGYRLIFSPIVFPAITKITVNGLDIADIPASTGN